MSKPPKIDRKDLRNPDEFQQKGAVFFELLLANRNHLIFLGSAIVVLVLGGYGYSLWQDHRNELAWDDFHKASKLEEKAKIEEFKKVFAAHGGTRVAQFAAAGVADFYFDDARKQVLKDPKATPESSSQAVEWYGKALEYSSMLLEEKQLLNINKGNALELTGKYDDSLKLYQTAVDGGGQIKGYALIQVARIYELKNDKPKAIETYEKVSQDFLNTEYAKLAKNSLRRMKNPVLNSESSFQ